MTVLTSLLILLVLSKVTGRLLRLVNQSEVIGEILAGILLGPALLNFIHPTLELSGIADLAIFLVIFSAGLEMEFHEVVDAFKSGALPIAVSAFFVPFLAGTLFAHFFIQLALSQSLIIGLCLAITALPVTIRIMKGLNILDTPMGHTTVGVVIIIDVIALLFLGVILDLPKDINIKKSILSILMTTGKMFGFTLFVFLTNQFLRKKQSQILRTKKMISFLVKDLGEEAIFGVAVLFVLLFSFLSEMLGFHFIIGAFFGGMLLNKDIISSDFYNKLEHSLTSVTQGFLAPLFFAFIGLQLSTSAFSDPKLLFFLIFIAIASKTLGSFLGGLLTKFDFKSTLGIAILLNGRGVTDLVVAKIALENRFIDQNVFSALVILAIVATFLTPIFFKLVQKN